MHFSIGCCSRTCSWVPTFDMSAQARLGAHLSAAAGPTGCTPQCSCGPGWVQSSVPLQAGWVQSSVPLQASWVQFSVLLRAGRVHSSVLLRGRPGGNFTDTDGTKFCVEHISTGCLPTRPAPQSSYCCSVCIYYKTFVKKYICKFVKMEYESHKGVGCCLFD